MVNRADADSWIDDPLWYKDAIIYQLHVRAFFDSNGDGIGDFRGLTQKLDYIHDLGVNTLWLLPFYPSPLRDDGYDISDYRNIHADYGARRDFRYFVREAHKRGLKVITELVINHTSDQHPWFQAARRAPPGSAKRRFYVWSHTDRTFPETRIIFTDVESSNWAWDPVAQAYYWHRFFSHQPDLNHNNLQVVKAVVRVMRFWLDQGVDGLRLDAIPYLCVREGTNNENLPETHDVIKRMRAVVDDHYNNRIFLAEANQWPEDVRDYFGQGDECHMAYHFPLMPRMYMAVAQEDRHPIVEIMEQTPDIPETCQWAVFLRNHDELTLEMVTSKERDYMYERYAGESRMRLNLGIRRRFAPLMENDPDKIKLMNSLLLSMPGSPIIYYGDEIGMGDNFYLGDRNGVRTPMQWSPDRNAGFSKADPQRLYLPPIMDPVYGYEAVNVEAQSRDPSSLLNWMKRMLAVRKAYKAFGRGSLEFLRPGNRKILAYIREYYDEESILCVANLARYPQPVELDLGRFRGQVPMEMLGHTPFPPIGELPYLLTLPGYGVYWFRLLAEAEVPAWHEELLPPLEIATVVLTEGWRSFFPQRLTGSHRSVAERLQSQLTRAILPKFLAAQRWFGAKGEEVERVELQPMLEWDEHGDWLFAQARVWMAGAEAQSYFLPLAIIWSEDEERIRPLLHFTLAKVRQRAQVGILCDAFADERFAAALVDAIGEGRRLSTDGGELHFNATAAYAPLVRTPPDELPVHRPGVEGSNTAVILGKELFLKVYRRLQRGINPELEMGRFLTEQTDFQNIIPVAGAVEYQEAQGGTTTLALLQGYISNQGDAWSYTLDYLERYLEHCLVEPEANLAEAPELHAPYLARVHTLGERTGELHRALCVKTGDPAFDPEELTTEDLQRWGDRARADARRALARLERRSAVPEAQREEAARAVALRSEIEARIDTVMDMRIEGVKTRHHGDYHLGQVLVVENDFVIIDFEGEPARSLAERRAKHCALRDVAGMLRSFSYAAYVALDRLSAERRENFAFLEPFAAVWERLVADAFEEGYEQGVADCAVYPRGPGHARMLIDVFVLEKVVYEICYEL
ncbi:MAG: maltose alpha-D-glucosyltransferase, partial [Gammaproteobacteria bacterium]|nr:maltose alpha-D-glucosyltransferase [Gammaproteobacteria bacterium]NIT64243.1 maltose alpha-D-glucosyltransferase [Gammaproteobacteria bacterium]NIV52654.1 maltose alpha-D-glucosyltransferase [Gammaproteobacteria bacterium]NIY32823.1 maltose alpha-D-glucosyltransferase [Gammaproteobacteria bacterium]